MSVIPYVTLAADGNHLTSYSTFVQYGSSVSNTTDLEVDLYDALTWMEGNATMWVPLKYSRALSLRYMTSNLWRQDTSDYLRRLVAVLRQCTFCHAIWRFDKSIFCVCEYGHACQLSSATDSSLNDMATTTQN